MQIEVIDPGESLWSIARRYGVSVEDLVRFNGMDNPNQLVLGQSIVVPVTGLTHIVRQGESVWSIASRYGVSVQSIIQLNQITNPGLIYVGMVLKIPERPKMTIESNAYLTPSNTERDTTLVNGAAPYLTYLSLFSYQVRRNGDLVPLTDERALTALRDSRAVGMMVIANFEEGTFSADITRAIFTDDAAKERLIANVLNIMGRKEYYALNIDFEHIFPEDRERYNNFLREVTPRLRAAGHPVSTALAPKASATQVGSWYEAHDYAAHGKIVDFVIIMTYEWGWSGGPPMAVAPIPQVRRVFDFAVSVIPRQKIMMGAPLYGYDWTLPFVKGGKFARSLSPEAAIDQARDVGARIQYDTVSQAPHYPYYDTQGKEHVVWFEDARSMQAKFNLIKEYRLRGISFWVLGNPFPQNWALLQDNFNIRRYK